MALLTALEMEKLDWFMKKWLADLKHQQLINSRNGKSVSNSTKKNKKGDQK